MTLKVVAVLLAKVREERVTSAAGEGQNRWMTSIILPVCTNNNINYYSKNTYSYIPKHEHDQKKFSDKVYVYTVTCYIVEFHMHPIPFHMEHKCCG